MKRKWKLIKLKFPEPQTLHSVVVHRGRQCDPCRGFSNWDSAIRSVKNLNERQLNCQQETARLKAELEVATLTGDKIDFENMVIKAKINHKKKECNSYLQWRSGQLHWRIQKIHSKQHQLAPLFLYSQSLIKIRINLFVNCNHSVANKQQSKIQNSWKTLLQL